METKLSQSANSRKCILCQNSAKISFRQSKPPASFSDTDLSYCFHSQPNSPQTDDFFHNENIILFNFFSPMFK